MALVRVHKISPPVERRRSSCCELKRLFQEQLAEWIRWGAVSGLPTVVSFLGITFYFTILYCSVLLDVWLRAGVLVLGVALTFAPCL